MKKIVCFMVMLLMAASVLKAQNVDMPPGKVQELLCKKWELDYAVIGEIRVPKSVAMPQLAFDIKKDKTFIVTGNVGDEGKKGNGTWNYDAKKKCINMIVDGEAMPIVTLKENQFLIDMQMDEFQRVKMFFKPVAK